MRNENERAEFEKVVREDHGHLNLLVRDDGKYVNLYTQSMFDLWCHARSRSSAVPAVTDAMVHAACAAHDAVGWKMASGETLVDMQHWMRKALNAALAAAPEPQQGEHVRVTDELPAPSSGEQAAAAPRRIRQPIQPLYVCPVDGRLRFQPNAIVQHLLDHGGIDMNALARLDFPRGDREQFAQLIGYSHDGYGTLSYATDRVYDKALERYERRQARAQASEPVSAPADARDGGIAALRAFANDVIAEHVQFDPAIQELAEQHGLLAQVTVTESCGDNCECAEFGFPTECYRKTAILMPADSAMGAGGGV